MTIASPPPTLGTPQLAFVRAWAEGIDPAIARERFLALDGSGDLRSARRELARLLEELRRVARLHGRPDIAALLLRDPEAMVESGSTRPSLDEFRRSFDDDFFSEAELLQLYEESHGKPDARSAARRRQRLRERLLQALQWLQERASRAPLGSDATALWFDQRVAQRLAVVGIRTLADLHFWVRSNGFHWHRKVPRLGVVGAQRIVRWLRDHESTLGVVPAASLVRRGQAPALSERLATEVGIVPLERLQLPSDERCGSRGSNRAPLERCKLSASNDLEAIRAWLEVQELGSHTWRAYRREAERWLLWAVFDRHKALSSLGREDCAAFRAFLAAPGPHWTAPRHTSRSSAAWRPWEGPLSARSCVTAEAIVRTLCDWLVRQRYLDSNPWDELLRPEPQSLTSASNLLNVSDLQKLQQWLKRQPGSLDQLRLRLLVCLAGPLGLHLSQIAAAQVSWLSALEDEVGPERWRLSVAGGRSERHEVVLDAEATALVRRYLEGRGLESWAGGAAGDVPLLSRLDSHARLSPARLRALLVSALDRCAVALYPADKAFSERLRGFSVGGFRRSPAEVEVSVRPRSTVPRVGLLPSP